jgi:Pyruvate/2-oxoacid:ferredoxin oxidoreductase delta subunit
MARFRRKIIRIDEEKCDGCGLCASACVEGAITIVAGKARLVSETYCDGLGACIGECPQGAITTIEREAEAFDETAVAEHLHRAAAPAAPAAPACACPGAAMRDLSEAAGSAPAIAASPTPSCLRNWPVQIHLVPAHAPYLNGAHLTIAADCTPFAYPDFHARFLADRVVMIGCPKLDDAAAYREKLSAIFRDNTIREVEVAIMEVPCCGGLARLVAGAIADSGREIPLRLTRIGVRGDLEELRPVAAPGSRA